MQTPFFGPNVEGGIISSFTYTAYSPTNLPVSTDRDFLGLYFNLNDEIQYKVGKETTGSIAKRHYNIVYMPQTSCQYGLEIGNYSTLCVRFTLKHLKLYAEHLRFPELDHFIDLVESGTPAILSKPHLPVTPEMFDIIHNVLHNRFTNDLRDFYLKAKTHSLLGCCLDHNREFFLAQIAAGDLAKIKSAYSYIVDNLHDSLSEDLLANKFAVDKEKFGSTFNIVFGKTVHKFIANERMKKAKNLLAKTATPINEIAVEVGYKRFTTFSSKFVLTFGYPPQVFRDALLNGVVYQDEIQD